MYANGGIEPSPFMTPKVHTGSNFSLTVKPKTDKLPTMKASYETLKSVRRPIAPPSRPHECKAYTKKDRHSWKKEVD